MEVVVAGGGTDVLDGDAERTDIFDNGLLETDADEVGVDNDDCLTDAPPLSAERGDTLAELREERTFLDPSTEEAEDSTGAGAASPCSSEGPGAVPRSPDEPGDDPSATPILTAPSHITPPQPVETGRDPHVVGSKLIMLLAAVAALAGLVVLTVAIVRQLRAANGSDTIGNLGYSYVCDKVSGSDPGVYGVGNCRASGGMQASGLIPVGQAYVLTPRAGNALGYTQSFSCSGGRADSPSMVVPKRCAAIGNPGLASR